jgi:hypothetical protein
VVYYEPPPTQRPGRCLMWRRAPGIDPMSPCVVGGWERVACHSRDLVVVNVNDGDGFVGLEGICTFVEHLGGVVANDGLCLHV